MKVLITGATGFLGNNVAKKIIEKYPNYQVYGLGRNQNKMLNIKKLNWIKGDLSDKDFTLRLKEENFNIIIHCAALSNTYGVYDEFYKSNILSTENIIQLAKKTNALLIYISTPSIFAKDKNQYDIVEDSDIDFDYIKDSNYISKHMDSDSCIDDITVQTKISDGKIDDIRFDGVACTISTASTSIMSELLIGKTTEEAKEIMDNYFKMIDQKEYDEDVLDEAIAFQNVGKQANRINCATIGWKAMREMIKESEDGKDE